MADSNIFQIAQDELRKSQFAPGRIVVKSIVDGELIFAALDGPS